MRLLSGVTKAWFTYISQTKSCGFVEPARSCDTDVLREDDSQLCLFINPAINVIDKMCGG